MSFTFCHDTCGAPLAPVAAHDGNFSPPVRICDANNFSSSTVISAASKL
ncbi:hypothetical protein [Candidatus Avelusimicrobium alvi]